MDLCASLVAIIVRPCMAPYRRSLAPAVLILVETVVALVLAKDRVIAATPIVYDVSKIAPSTAPNAPIRTQRSIGLILTPRTEYIPSPVYLRLDTRLIYSSSSRILPDLGLTALSLLWVDRHRRAYVARRITLNSRLLTLHSYLRRLLPHLWHLLPNLRRSLLPNLRLLLPLRGRHHDLSLLAASAATTASVAPALR